jgi:hypothetical protein
VQTCSDSYRSDQIFDVHPPRVRPKTVQHPQNKTKNNLKALIHFSLLTIQPNHVNHFLIFFLFCLILKCPPTPRVIIALAALVQSGGKNVNSSIFNSGRGS